MLSEQTKLASLLVTLVSYTGLNLIRILMTNMISHIFQWRQFGVDRAFKTKYIGEFNIEKKSRCDNAIQKNSQCNSPRLEEI